MIVVTGNCGNYLFLFFHLINVLYDTKVLCTLIGIKFTLIYFVIFEGKNRKVNYLLLYYNNRSFNNEDLKYSRF